MATEYLLVQTWNGEFNEDRDVFASRPERDNVNRSAQSAERALALCQLLRESMRVLSTFSGTSPHCG